MSIYRISTNHQWIIEHQIVFQIFRMPILTNYVFSCHVFGVQLRAKIRVSSNIDVENAGFQTQSCFSYLFYIFAVWHQISLPQNRFIIFIFGSEIIMGKSLQYQKNTHIHVLNIPECMKTIKEWSRVIGLQLKNNKTELLHNSSRYSSHNAN